MRSPAAAANPAKGAITDAGKRSENQAVDNGLEAELPEEYGTSVAYDRKDDEADDDLGPARARELVGLR